jgi:excinuclease UvrABC nuclease subunit
MLLLAEQLEFEQAAKLRDKIQALEQPEQGDDHGDQKAAAAQRPAASSRGKRSRRR